MRRSREQGSDNYEEEDHAVTTKEDDESSVGHYSDTREFDEDADDSDPSCDPTCPVLCRQHITCYTSSGDGDDMSEKSLNPTTTE